jgi:predicted nucleic acid-binding Zn ribbon protein
MMHKQLGAPGIHFKGKGFSKTDVKKPYDPFDERSLDEGMNKVKK